MMRRRESEAVSCTRASSLSSGLPYVVGAFVPRLTPRHGLRSSKPCGSQRQRRRIWSSARKVTPGPTRRGHDPRCRGPHWGFRRGGLNVFPGARIWCFEPLPMAFQSLSARWERNPHVTAVPAAAGRAPGRAPLYVDSGAPTHSSLVIRAGSTQVLEVDVVQLDDFLDDLGRPVVAYLKVDAEGADYDVLVGASRAISS